MKRVLVFAAVAFCTPNISASDDLLACVDPDVVTAFLAVGSRSDLKISDELPDEFSFVEYPDDFRFIASSTSAMHKGVAFRTDLGPDEAVSAFEQAFADKGWSAMGQPQRGLRMKGFRQAQSSSQQQASLCHSSGKTMSVLARREDRGTFVSLWEYPDSRNLNCNQMPADGFGMNRGRTSEVMPNLELPKNARSGGAGSGGIIIGSGDDAETHVRIRTKLQPAEVLTHFANQLVLQDWTPGSDWASDLSHGSTWNLNRADLPRVVGTLHLVVHSEGDYTIQFSILAI